MAMIASFALIDSIDEWRDIDRLDFGAWTVFHVFHPVGKRYAYCPFEWLQMLPSRDNRRIEDAGGGEAFLRRLGTGATHSDELAPAFLGALLKEGPRT